MGLRLSASPPRGRVGVSGAAVQGAIDAALTQALLAHDVGDGLASGTERLDFSNCRIGQFALAPELHAPLSRFGDPVHLPLVADVVLKLSDQRQDMCSLDLPPDGHSWEALLPTVWALIILYHRDEFAKTVEKIRVLHKVFLNLRIFAGLVDVIRERTTQVIVA